jgi:hypothetical protein
MNQSIRDRWSGVAPLAVVIAVASSCNLSSLVHDDRPIPNDVDQVPVLRAAIVPALLPLVDAAGLLRFPLPNVGSDEMSLDTALVQAGEYLFYGLNVFFIRASVEGQRGAFIDLPTLVACNRPQLARSVYERPPDSLPPALRLQLVDYWMIPFCGTRRTPEIVVSVATRGNNVRYKNSRPVGDTVSQTLAFRVAGIPWEWKVEHLVTAEEAVNEVYAVAGVRAARLPEIALAQQINGQPASGHPSCAVWRIALERPLRIAAVYSLRRLDVAELYVAEGGCPAQVTRTILLTPWHEQPTAREFAASIRDSTAASGFRREVHTARYRAPVAFESVVIER